MEEEEEACSERRIRKEKDKSPLEPETQRNRDRHGYSLIHFLFAAPRSASSPVLLVPVSPFPVFHAQSVPSLLFLFALSLCVIQLQFALAPLVFSLPLVVLSLSVTPASLPLAFALPL